MLAAIVLFWVVTPVCAWIVAERKGRSGEAWAAATILLSPMAFLVLLCLAPVDYRALNARPAAYDFSQAVLQAATQHDPPPQPASTTKTCPDCAETVLAAARICRFCRHEFPAPEAAAAAREIGDKERGKEILADLMDPLGLRRLAKPEAPPVEPPTPPPDAAA